jgi:hypothetical protein
MVDGSLGSNWPSNSFRSRCLAGMITFFNQFAISPWASLWGAERMCGTNRKLVLLTWSFHVRFEDHLGDPVPKRLFKSAINSRIWHRLEVCQRTCRVKLCFNCYGRFSSTRRNLELVLMAYLWFMGAIQERLQSVRESHYRSGNVRSCDQTNRSEEGYLLQSDWMFMPPVLRRYGASSSIECLNLLFAAPGTVNFVGERGAWKCNLSDFLRKKFGLWAAWSKRMSELEFQIGPLLPQSDAKIIEIVGALWRGFWVIII